MKYAKIVLFILLAGFVLIQFIPTMRNESDEILPSDISLTYDVHEKVLSILKTSCYDCHSNMTDYPWYNKIQPLSWMLESHIKQGKKELNFSEFGTYSVRKQESKLKSMASQIENGQMPLPSYTLFHRDAIFTESEKSLLLDWVDNLRDSL
jgi:hypothetical protein